MALLQYVSIAHFDLCARKHRSTMRTEHRLEAHATLAFLPSSDLSEAIP
jgi:hypothetical protein